MKVKFIGFLKKLTKKTLNICNKIRNLKTN